jgi:hypothetical protein
MLTGQLLPAAAVSQRSGSILWSLSFTILAVTILATCPILRSSHITILALAGLSYLAILLIAGALILAVLDAVFIAVSCAGSWTISILCGQGKT